jgi:hypothetical protein
LDFKKKSFEEARKILDDLCLSIDGKVASTNKRPLDRSNPDGNKTAWWLEHTGRLPSFESNRSKAYLRAYVEIAGPHFCGAGTLTFIISNHLASSLPQARN